MTSMFRMEHYLLLSSIPRLHMEKYDLSILNPARSIKGVKSILTYKDIPGENQIGGDLSG